MTVIRSSCFLKGFFFVLYITWEQFLSEYSVSLFRKRSCGHLFLNGYCLYFRRVLVYIQCICQIFLFGAYCSFQRAIAVIHLSGTNYFMRPLTVIYLFHWYCASLDQALAVIPYFKGSESIRRSSCSHPFDGWPFFYYKKAVTATHYFKFTVL